MTGFMWHVKNVVLCTLMENKPNLQSVKQVSFFTLNVIHLMFISKTLLCKDSLGLPFFAEHQDFFKKHCVAKMPVRACFNF